MITASEISPGSDTIVVLFRSDLVRLRLLLVELRPRIIHNIVMVLASLRGQVIGERLLGLAPADIATCSN